MPTHLPLATVPRRPAAPGWAARARRSALAGLLALAGATGQADRGGPPGDGQGERHRDEQRALAAVQAGRALPLAGLLVRLEALLPGHAIDVELDDDDGVLVYEITWLLPDRRVLKLALDAATGHWLELKGQQLETVFRRSAASRVAR